MTASIKIQISLNEENQILAEVTGARGEPISIAVESLAEIRDLFALQESEDKIRAARATARQRSSNFARTRARGAPDLAAQVWKAQTEFAARVRANQGNAAEQIKLRNLNGLI